MATEHNNIKGNNKAKDSFNKFKISAIVPFYNEEATVAVVAKTLIDSGIFTEIILVNDGSSDGGNEVLKPFLGKIKLINLPGNTGKGSAVVTGVKQAIGDIVVFLDADLLTLNSEHIRLILNPLITQGYSASMGFPFDKWYDLFFIPVGGQRSYFKKDLLPHLSVLEAGHHAGFEVMLNDLYKNTKVKKVPLRGLGHVVKTKKRKGKTLMFEIKNWTFDTGKIIGLLIFRNFH